MGSSVLVAPAVHVFLCSYLNPWVDFGSIPVPSKSLVCYSCVIRPGIIFTGLYALVSSFFFCPLLYNVLSTHVGNVLISVLPWDQARIEKNHFIFPVTGQ